MQALISVNHLRWLAIYCIASLEYLETLEIALRNQLGLIKFKFSTEHTVSAYDESQSLMMILETRHKYDIRHDTSYSWYLHEFWIIFRETRNPGASRQFECIRGSRDDFVEPDCILIIIGEGIIECIEHWYEYIEDLVLLNSVASTTLSKMDLFYQRL